MRPTREHVRDTYGGDWEPVTAPEPAAAAAPAAPREPRARADRADHAAADPDEEDEDPSDAQAARAREEIGPLIDRWLDSAREALDRVDSLDAWRRWIDEDAQEAIDARPVRAALGLALVASDLAGRYDVQERPAEFAQPSYSHVQSPFREQVEFFRGKVNIPTDTWSDIWQEQHDVGFMVAGAARDDLLSDLREAVDASINDGETLRKFRKRFDAIVAKHGWQYKGGRAWRTRVIYETNLRQSYNAGRYKQMKAAADRRPFWRYRHSHASVNPREEHVAWDGMILRHDAAWWRTHAPSNGWGCRCFVESLSERDMRRLGRTDADTPPPTRYRTATVGRGAARRTVRVPEGIDAGFAYAPGAGNSVGRAARDRIRGALAQEPAIASRGVAEALSAPRSLPALSAEWRRWRAEHAGRKPAGEAFEAGALTPATLRALAARDISPATAQIVATDRALAHMTRPAKASRSAALSDADLDRLPEILARPKAVLLDTAAKGDGDWLVYVFEPADREAGKVAIRVNFREKVAGRRAIAANSVRSAGYVQPGNLREARYTVLEGSLD